MFLRPVSTGSSNKTIWAAENESIFKITGAPKDHSSFFPLKFSSI